MKWLGKNISPGSADDATPGSFDSNAHWFGAFSLRMTA